MRVIVTGDRAWYAPDLAEQIVTRLLVRYGPDLVIVHGDATGIDRSFAEVCGDLGVEQEAHAARWEEIDHPQALIRYRDGRPFNAKAGPIRNQAMIDLGAGLCVAVHRYLANSRGTKDCCRRAIRAGIPTWLIESEEAEPVRLVVGDDRLG